MEIIRFVEEKVLSVVESVLKILEGGIDLQTYELTLKKELDHLGCDILQSTFFHFHAIIYCFFRKSTGRKNPTNICIFRFHALISCSTASFPTGGSGW